MANINDANQTERLGADTQIVVGLFDSGDDAHRAINELKQSGFRSSQIGAAFRSSSAGSASAVGSGLGTGSGSYGSTSVPPATGSFHEGTGSGTSHTSAHGHSWWDKLKDLFEGDSDDTARSSSKSTGANFENSTSTNYGTGEGHLATYGNSPFGNDRNDYDYDYQSSEFEGSLTGAGLPQDRARSLVRQLGPQGAIVTVSGGRSQDAEDILARNNGRVRFEDTANDYADYSPQTSTGSSSAPSYTSGSQQGNVTPGNELSTTNRIQLFGEMLRVHKDRISRGEVRMRKEVITETQAIEVPVTREELVMERIPVTDRTPAANASFGQEGEIRIPLTEEQVRVDKQPYVREEVVVGKREVTGTEAVDDQVRHEELRVEDSTNTSAAAGNRGVSSDLTGSDRDVTDRNLTDRNERKSA